MSILPLARQVTDAGARVWLDGKSIRIRGGRALPNAIIEQLRRNKLEVIEALRRLQVCAECGAVHSSRTNPRRGGASSVCISTAARLHRSGCGKLKTKQLKRKG